MPKKEEKNWVMQMRLGFHGVGLRKIAKTVNNLHSPTWICVIDLISSTKFDIFGETIKKSMDKFLTLLSEDKVKFTFLASPTSISLFEAHGLKREKEIDSVKETELSDVLKTQLLAILSDEKSYRKEVIEKKKVFIPVILSKYFTNCDNKDLYSWRKQKKVFHNGNGKQNGKWKDGGNGKNNTKEFVNPKNPLGRNITKETRREIHNIARGNNN